jgi:beta-lactamase class A
MRPRYAFSALFLAVLIAVSCAACGSAATQKSATVTHLKKARKRSQSEASSQSQAEPAPEPESVSVARQLTAQQRVSAAVAPLIKADRGHVAVAVDDLTSGTEASYNGTSEFVTASIVKVDILATLLYELQKSGQSLTAHNEDLATTMIENSDNDSASALYADIGASTGLDQANQVFGLTHTTAGTDGEWGLTSTTVDDQLRLLRQIAVTPSALTPAAQDYIQHLMGDVESDQQWGVPAAADSGTAYLVKNGWLPNPALWSINSIGEIDYSGHQLLVTVLSADNSSEASGISAIQAVAQQAVSAVAGG